MVLYEVSQLPTRLFILFILDTRAKITPLKEMGEHDDAL